MTVLLVNPPLVQPNTPYPAIPMLTRFLRSNGADVVQRDLSIELLLKIFCRDFIGGILQSLQKSKKKHSAEIKFFLDAGDQYLNTIDDTIAFLQGKRPELAWRIAARNFLPEGPHFQEVEESEEESPLRYAYGTMGTHDQAKYLASLYLDDLSNYISQAADADFGFGKYGEKLAVSLSRLDPILQRLKQTTPIDEILDQLAIDAVKSCPGLEYAGISVPFPGTLYGAMRIAGIIRQYAPQCKIGLGGGYVNSELRQCNDRRINNYFDEIFFDEGYLPLGRFVGLTNLPECLPGIVPPDYQGLYLSKYFSVVEVANPMHRIWTDGLWLKLQVSRGCYWHKCAFCDLGLDYISKYEPAQAQDVVNAMELLMNETGHNGFHLVDEAVAPALLRAICEEIIRRGIHPVWWGNIRFDKSFTPELAELMADAGCIAVTGGLECANDRLLALMNKGITLASARKAMTALANAGILVHAYLMYAFPTETAAEAIAALEFVRQCFENGILHSAFWHRFALTVHSPIMSHPEQFGLIIDDKIKPGQTIFARNEINYREKGKATDWETIGQGLSLATYNYMTERGLELPAEYWICAHTRCAHPVKE